MTALDKFLHNGILKLSITIFRVCLVKGPLGLSGHLFPTLVPWGRKAKSSKFRQTSKIPEKDGDSVMYHLYARAIKSDKESAKSSSLHHNAVKIQTTHVLSVDVDVGASCHECLKVTVTCD